MDTNTIIAIGIVAILVAIIVVAFRYRGGIRAWGEGHGIRGGIIGTGEVDQTPKQRVERVRSRQGNATVRSSTGLGTTVKGVDGAKDATVDLSNPTTPPKRPPPAQ